MSERLRLETLTARDGLDAAKHWAARTAEMYRLAVADPTHFASEREWKSRFEASIRELGRFAETGALP